MIVLSKAINRATLVLIQLEGCSPTAAACMCACMGLATYGSCYAVGRTNRASAHCGA